MWRYAGALVLAGGLSAGWAEAGLAQDAAQQAALVRYNIPPGPLAPALNRFAEASGLQFISGAEVSRDRRSQGLSGEMTVSVGLSRLLAGTGLTYRFTGRRTVMIYDPEAAGVNAQSGVQLETINVEGDNSDRAVSGLVPTRAAAGTKTDTPIVETPQIVNVVTQNQIAAQGAQTVIQALRYVPAINASFGDNDFRYNTVQTRGFYLREYVDGVRMPFSAYSVAVPLIDPYALERIEVLKGPASVLYGQNTPGGILNQISKRPSATRSGEVQLQTGSFGRRQGAFDFTGAIDPSAQFLYRMTGLVREADGQVDFANEKHYFLAPSFTWRPTNDTTWTFLSNFQSDNGISDYQSVPAAGSLRPNPNGVIPRDRYLGEPNYEGFRRDQFSVGYAFEHRFNEAFLVRQNLKFTDVDVDARAVPPLALAADGRTLSRFISRGQARGDTLGIDNQAQLRFVTGPLAHTLLVGLDYLKLIDKYDFSSGVGLAPIDVFNPVYGAATPALAPRFWNVQHMTQLGVYVQDQIKVDRFILTLNGRHDRAVSATENFLFFNSARTNTHQDDKGTSGRVALSYLFDNGIAPYVSYSNSFEPLGGTMFGGVPFKPTTGVQKEAGVKYQPPGTNTLVSAAVFDILQQNVLTPDPVNNGFNVQTGEARSRGFELEAKINLAQGLNTILAYSYTDTEITRDNTSLAGVNNTGKQLPRTPTHQSAAWVDYAFQPGPLHGLSLGVGARFIGESYTEADNQFQIPSRVLWDAMLSYDFSRLHPDMRGVKLQVNASNIFDKTYVSYCGTVLQCVYGQGRRVFATMKYQW